MAYISISKDKSMKERWFKYVLPDSILRTMSRKQYKATMHWLRFAAWRVSNAINWEQYHKRVRDTMLFGSDVIFCEDELTQTPEVKWFEHGKHNENIQFNSNGSITVS